MRVVELHGFAYGMLRDVLEARYMPRGWTKEGSRRVDQRWPELRGLLEVQLQQVTDKLMLDPGVSRVREIAQAAALKPSMRGMVEKMVELLCAEPSVDQEAAYGLASLKDLRSTVHRLTLRLEGLLHEVEGLAEESAKVGQDLTALVDATKKAMTQVTVKAQSLEQLEFTLSQDISTS